MILKRESTDSVYKSLIDFFTDNIRHFTFLICHLRNSCAARGSESADILERAQFALRRGTVSCFPLLLLRLELLDHEITGPDVKESIRSQRDNLISLSLQREHICSGDTTNQQNIHCVMQRIVKFPLTRPRPNVT